jgi:hypothetical protein
MQLDVKEMDENGDGTPATAYRPQNVIEWLAALEPDLLARYLHDNEITHPLPDDVLAEIQRRRQRP